MSRRSRHEARMLKEQDTVGMRRAERKEQEELAGKQKLEIVLTKAQRMAKMQERETSNQPARVARPGKPLRR